MAPSEWGACCSPKFSVSKALVGSVRPNKPPHRESRESFPSSERGVRVLALCPGATETPFFDRVCAEEASLGKCAMPESVVDAAMKAFAKNRSHAIVRAGNLLDGAGQPPRVARALGPAHRRSDEATLQTSADCTRTRAREPASQMTQWQTKVDCVVCRKRQRLNHRIYSSQRQKRWSINDPERPIAGEDPVRHKQC